MEKTNKVRFTVEFDSAAWESMDEESRADWIDQATAALNEVGYVSEVAHVMPFEDGE